MSSADEILRELGRLAADAGPALVPVGHDELLRSVTATARSLFEAAACSIALVDDSGEALVFTAASGAGADEIVGTSIPVGRGIAGWVAASEQPIAIGDVTRDPRFARDVAEATGYVPRSILAMPLQGTHDVLGVLEVLDPGVVDADGENGSGLGGERGLAVLGLLARQAALAVEQAQVFGDFGRALFQAAGRAAEGTELGAALDEVADSAPGPEAAMAELAASLRTLAAAGPAERRAAAALLAALAGYVRGRA
jgi:signal transduction protein with GAF and PtsI domain